MADKYWIGGATPVAQVVTLTVGGTVEIGDKFLWTFANGKVLSVSATTTSTSTTASEFATAWNAETGGEFAEITAAANGSDVVLTADEAGKEFSGTASTTESNGGAADLQTFAQSTTTANAGPQDLGTATNYNGGSLPTNGDTLTIELNDDEIRYGLEDLAAVALAALYVPASFTGKAQLPLINEDNAGASYPEYRPRFLKFSTPPTIVDIGFGEGDGTRGLHLDLGQTANGASTTINVDNTGTNDIEDTEAVVLKVTRTGTGYNVLNVPRGSVGVAIYPGETSDFSQSGGFIRVGYRGSQESDARVRLGSGVTMPSELVQTGGELYAASNITTFTKKGGTTHLTGSATQTTINNDKGTIFDRTTGTTTTLQVGSEGAMDYNGTPQGKTVTNCDVFSGAAIYDDQGRVTFTNGIDLNRVDVQLSGEVDLRLGPHRRVTLGTVA